MIRCTFTACICVLTARMAFRAVNFFCLGRFAIVYLNNAALSGPLCAYNLSASGLLVQNLQIFRRNPLQFGEKCCSIKMKT